MARVSNAAAVVATAAAGVSSDSEDVAVDAGWSVVVGCGASEEVVRVGASGLCVLAPGAVGDSSGAQAGQCAVDAEISVSVLS